MSDFRGAFKTVNTLKDLQCTTEYIKMYLSNYKTVPFSFIILKQSNLHLPSKSPLVL